MKFIVRLWRLLLILNGGKILDFIHIYETNLSSGMELNGLTYESLELIAKVHQIAASLFQMKLNLRLHLQFRVRPSNVDLETSFHYLNGDIGIELIRVDPSDIQLFICCSLFIWQELTIRFMTFVS